MSFNTGPFNSYAYNSNAVTIIGTGSGTLVGVEQNVAIVGSGSLVDVEQVTEFFFTGSGKLVDVEQVLESTGSGTAINIAQKVVSAAESTRLQRRKYEVTVFLGGYQIPDSQLTDKMKVEFEEDSAASCTVVLLPPKGTQDLQQYFGKQLVVTGTGTNGVTYRMFTGVVDIVDFDVINSKTILRATNRRKELLNNIPNPLDKFGTPFDTSYLINDALSGVDLIEAALPFAPKSLDFDAYNNYHYTSWTPKATADLTLNNANIFRRTPTVELVTRGRIVNKVSIEVNYQFKRLHYVQVPYTWNAPYSASGQNFSVVLLNGYSLTRKETIIAAVQGTGWPTKGAIVFQDLPPPGWYAGVGWVGDIQQSTTVGKRDVNGDQLTDSNGNPIYRTSSRRSYSSSTNGVHASSASFTLTNRWSQQGVKKYTLSVESLSSQAMFGVIDRESSYSINDQYDSQRWDNYEGYTSGFVVGDGAVLTLNTSQTYNVTSREHIAQSNIQAVLDKASTEILKSHRENLVMCQTQFLPFIQLHHTIAVNTNRINTKGKVKSYKHVVDFRKTDSWTEFKLAFYFLGSGGSTSTRTLPTITPSNPESFPAARSLPSTYGVDPETPGSLKKDGFFGNRWGPGSFFKTEYTEQFRVDTPAIGSGMVDGIEFSGSANYNLAIPAGTLVITYVK